ncbi:MAG: pantoate--beta-alanine ligase [Salibacteraceae bacterium]|nr:pantoate--beta-alanine ligase [Salibacteraceae bacterium]
MKVFHSNLELDLWRNSAHNGVLSIGFVPTMGALHVGHLKIIERACRENDFAVCSIYVNPTQFNNAVDLEKYPRNLQVDLDLLSQYPNLIVYHPSDKDIYPSSDFKVPPQVELGELATVMEGENRPGHFEGVLTVVKRLFEQVKPTKSYFGLKDFQQYLVVKKLAETFFPEIEIVANEIIRSEKGLALSSRNKRLSAAGKIEAEKLNGYLKELLIMSDKVSIQKSLDRIRARIESNSNIYLEYLTIADAENLSEYIDGNNKESRAFIAARVENVRLIDNMGL